MKLRINTLALQDLEAGRRFYEQQQQGLGAYFTDSLISDIESLLIHSGVHQRILGYHRGLSKRFPYAIYYKVTGEIIEVWRVLDCRQNPRKTSQKLKTDEQ